MLTDHEKLRLEAYIECIDEQNLMQDEVESLMVHMYYGGLTDEEKVILSIISECRDKKVPQTLN